MVQNPARVIIRVKETFVGREEEMEARPSRSGRLGVSDGRSGGGGGGGGGGVSSAVVSSMSSAEHVRSMKQFLSGALAGGISKTTTAPLARMTILYQVEGMPGVVSVPNVVQPAGRATATTAAAATAATGGASAQGNVNFGARMAGGGTVSTSGTGAASGARPPLLHAIKEVVRREGIRSLWKGNGAMLLHRLPYSGSNFYAYETMTAFLKPRNVSGAADETLPWMYRWKLHCLVSGAVAATIAATVAYPLDLLRTRLAVHGGRDMNIEKTFFAIVQRDGVAGLYRGLGPTLAQVSPCIASSFWAYELGLDTWRRLGAHAVRHTESSAMHIPVHSC